VATTTTKLMTFAEFEQLPDPEGFRQELRHGELFNVPPAKWKHFLLQERLRDLLQDDAGAAGKAATEFGFRPLSGDDYRIADVAFTSIERWKATDPDGYFRGAPEIVIEILSPSNTATEMLDKEKLCLENGCVQFWIVDPALRLVKVSTPDGRAFTYSTGQEIPLLFGGRLSVDSIFTPAEG
jgi:Uma2 family endonuclease